MRYKFALIGGLLALGIAAGAVLAQSSADFGLWWNVIAGGGGRSAASSYALNGSIGQPVVGAVGSASYGLGAGFWPGAAEAATPEPTPTSTGVPPSTPTRTRTPTRTATAGPSPTATPPGIGYWVYLPVLVKQLP